MIEFENVSKTYEQQPALNDLNLTINDGELFVLVGPSGSGKTTLLKMINKLIEPTTGTVKIDGQDVGAADIRQLRHQIGYVLQAGALFPNMTVEQNAAIQLDQLDWDVRQKHDRINELLTRVDLDPQTYMERMPSELSGGEAQRVGIVRALASQPKLILMDEPFSALDPLSRRRLQQLVLKLHQELACTIVFVTHDMQEAIKLADRLAVIHNGDLLQVGRPQEIIANPASEFVADFFDDGTTRNLFLSQVLKTGFGRLPEPADQPVKLAGTDTIFTWADLLNQHPRQLVTVDDLVLEPQDLLSYMSQIGQVS
ncbi:Fe(3+)-transporting ATPase [Paucilactobacillus vaccinostercus DSM 20634]|uniref:ABC-type quaternary amine transporter n=1 Tax=Paucilactobacillus vaccinostercus DSM 20634 TaxID=1423813 RepID=A0A0R2A166_9LACO|nr:ABC transporter ATP-binding protein [Paucilactobacillus vaccinostercus]KRM60824.1 Fe(3+)-transporting ATPase [Paucilactobacillus vaccinostercus DSM 20634]